MSLKRVSYKDSDGRFKVVLLPEGVPEDQADMGVPVGPPSLEKLGLPLELDVRLNNELYHRGIITTEDVLKKKQEIISALQSALKVDVNSILSLYLGEGYKNARQESAKVQSNTPLPNRGQSQPKQRSRIPVSRSRSRS